VTEKYPKEKLIYGRLGEYYRDRDNEKSLDALNIALELDPNYSHALNTIAYTYMRMQDFDKAIEYFKKYSAVFPTDANPHDSMGEVYFTMGRLDEAIAKYKEAVQIKPDFYSSLRSLSYLYALKEDYSQAMDWIDRSIDITQGQGVLYHSYYYKGFYHYWLGNLEKSLQNLQKAADLAAEVENKPGITQIDILKVWIYHERDRLDLSRNFAESWVIDIIKVRPQNQNFHEAAYNYFMGMIEIKEGKIDSAKKRVVEIEQRLGTLPSRQKTSVTFFRNMLQAEIYFAEGLFDKCITAMENAPPRPQVAPQWPISTGFYNAPFRKDLLPRAYEKKGELDKAIAAYEKLVVFDPESQYRYLIHPIYHYRLAKLYEEKGWKGKAIEQYEKFLEIWKEADPELTEVEDAKKRLANLTGGRATPSR
jgi:tetratricopeptide (TPR) repeat protein